jgi:SAM-dependent methyltransferase
MARLIVNSSSSSADKVVVEFHWHSYRYFPYEQRLALREIAALTGSTPEEIPGGVLISVPAEHLRVLSRTTYFRDIQIDGGVELVPSQARLEGSATLLHSHSVERVPRLSRQSTRYSAHGIHEYRGKFNPQIVRALANILEIDSKSVVFDPFCGSGTSLLECAHLGFDAIGTDVNPLAVLIAKAKLDAVRIRKDVLLSQSERLLASLRRACSQLDCSVPFRTADLRILRGFSSVSLPNAEYLEQWFPISVLVQLRFIERNIAELDNHAVQRLARVVLSDRLRHVSLQDPGDLRIRRRKDPSQNYPALRLFMEAFSQRVAVIVRARSVLGRCEGQQVAIEHDSRLGLPKSVRQRFANRIDAAITSPPYATALPYIDTQRLSLAFLGLLSRSAIHRLERDLIGTREIVGKDRNGAEQEFRMSARELPDRISGLCIRAHDLVIASADGFRRRNVPALLWRYFTNMKAVFAAAHDAMTQHAKFALVVGPNRSHLGGEEVVVDTPALLASVAESVGWNVEELIELDAYPRFDLHRENSITTEKLVILSRV